ncbi:Cullin [Arachis hypogaea]|nr:Cullin [Arachis hypogaea]
MRRFGFCENAKMDQVKTSIENDVLTVTVPRAEEVTWAKLKSAIYAIFLKQPDSCDLEKLYQAVSDLFIYKMAENLYQQIEMECEAHVSIALQSLVGQSPDLVVFLSLVERCWQDLCDQMLMIRGEAVDRTLLNHLLKMFTALGIYAESFEKPFLECTSEFYAAQGMKYM